MVGEEWKVKVCRKRSVRTFFEGQVKKRVLNPLFRRCCMGIMRKEMIIFAFVTV